MTELFVNLGGMCVCEKHLGMEGQAALHRRPKAKTFTTPMTRWERVNDASKAWWLEDLGEPMDCESCRFLKQREGAL